ncbi:DUF998 domain-containing protein [Micromonospora costi]|uniref:DUF998 domain-containing protein n=1 Tax=Micromonospora costi TaxID=1530042 RepID=A0A3B0AD06_9ACTN|nr:DUF998 domain-containing protein [Micromonospora costi]RKN58405.1 DUF998 domain-containing protein [Micromonospora costi]
MPGTRTAGLLALGGIALAALLAVIGHVEVNDDLSPWSLTVSDFAVSDRGGVIDTAMVVLALATAVLLPPLRRPAAARPTGRPTAGPGRGPFGWAEALLTTWVLGLLLAAVVPTNEPGLPMDTAAYVHRYASVVAFLALPVGGWLLAARLPAPAGRWVRGFAVASVVLAVAMVWSAYPGDRVLIGLVERMLILTEVAALTVLALTVARPITRDHAVVVPDKGDEAPANDHHNCMIDAKARPVTPARAA